MLFLKGILASIAVDGGHQEVVKVLIQHGAEVNGQRSVSGWSCLHQAAYRVNFH